jgi:hypothetical protein
MAWQWSDSVWHEPNSLYLYRKIGFGWFKSNLAKKSKFCQKNEKTRFHQIFQFQMQISLCNILRPSIFVTTLPNAYMTLTSGKFTNTQKLSAGTPWTCCQRRAVGKAGCRARVRLARMATSPPTRAR